DPHELRPRQPGQGGGHGQAPWCSAGLREGSAGPAILRRLPEANNCASGTVMNANVKIEIGHSTCPHDCPSACALDVEVIDGTTIGRVRGSKVQTYTAGVVCAKVGRYSERINHPDRVRFPLRRVGAK